MTRLSLFFLSTATSVCTSLIVCSFFLGAGAAANIQTTGSSLPYYAVSSGAWTNTTTLTSNMDGLDNTSCHQYYDAENQNCTAPWYSLNSWTYVGTIDDTRYVQKVYVAECGDGEVMTGYSWGKLYGNRFAMVPQCSKISYTPSHH